MKTTVAIAGLCTLFTASEAFSTGFSSHRSFGVATDLSAKKKKKGKKSEAAAPPPAAEEEPVPVAVAEPEPEKPAPVPAPAAVAEPEPEKPAPVPEKKEPEPAPAPPKKKEAYYQALSPVVPTKDEEGAFTWEEKQQISQSVFEANGFFPDWRSEDQLPESVRKMREAKSEKELKKIKAKYAGMSEADEAFAVLCDLGLMENYDPLGEYSDDFDDFAM